MSELKTDPGFSFSLLSVDLHIVFVLFQRGLEHPGRKMIQNKYTEFKKINGMWENLCKLSVMCLVNFPGPQTGQRYLR